jgi:hypothetical protein
LSKRYVAGGIALVVLCIGVFVLVLVMVWSSNDFHLPPLYLKLATAAASLVVLVGLAVILALNKTWFDMVTVLWVLVTVTLLAYAVQETRESETRRLLPSQFIFPIWEYSPKLNDVSIRIRNNGTIALVVTAALSMAWGFVAALLMKPPFVGWIFFCIGGLGFLLIALEALFTPLVIFWHNFALVADNPLVVDQARETALASQLGADAAAFADQDAEQGMASDVNDDPSAALGDASGGDGGSEEESFKVLRRLQMYWNFEEASEVDHLQVERAKFLAHPLVPEELDVSERARYIAEEMANYDARIAQVFEEQTRILVMFQLLINIGAMALQKQNRARVKAFLRKYFARKQVIRRAREKRDMAQQDGVPLSSHDGMRQYRASLSGGGPVDDDDDSSSSDSQQITEEDLAEAEREESAPGYRHIDLATANAVDIRRWARENTELTRKAALYLAEEAMAHQNAKASMEAQRIAAAERKKLTGNMDSGAVTPAQSARSIAQPPSKRMDLEEEKEQRRPISSPSAVSVSVTPGPSSRATTGTGPVPLHVGGGGGASGSGGAGAGKASNGFTVDAHLYRQRSVSFALDELSDIRGPTAEQVVEKARKAVASIIARQRAADAFFADPHFPQVPDLDALIECGSDPADKALLGAASVHPSSPAGGKKQVKAVWKRPHEIVSNPRVFASPTGEIDAAQIIQGSIEDCYLLAALSVLSRDARRIRDLFVVSEYNEYGIYGLCFFVDGEWRAVFVDDQFPVDEKGQLAFARSKTKNEFWLPILEKCYAKLYGHYSRIIGGLVHSSFKDLTGGITDEVALDSPDSGAFDGRLWQRVFTFHKLGYLMGCGNPKPTSGNFDKVSGIVQGHAYAILDLREIGDLKLIRLRNPWYVFGSHQRHTYRAW